MSDLPAGGQAAAVPPARILTLEIEAADLPLAQALSAAGCRVDTVSCAADLAAALGSGAYDAVVLDLSSRGTAEAVLAAAGAALERLGAAAEEDPRPAVVAVRPSGGHGGREGRLHVDVTITTRDIDQVIRQVEGAVAVRRLARARAEIDRLRQAVLFARQTAHELAQPLTTILARAQLLRSLLKPEDPHFRAVGIICEEADRLARMVEEFQKLKAISPPPAARMD